MYTGSGLPHQSYPTSSGRRKCKYGDGKHIILVPTGLRPVVAAYQLWPFAAIQIWPVYKRKQKKHLQKRLTKFSA